MRMQISKHKFTLIEKSTLMYPTLPNTFNLYEYLSFDNTLSIAETYTFQNTTHEIKFSSSKPSEIRIKYQSNGKITTNYYINNNLLTSIDNNTNSYQISLPSNEIITMQLLISDISEEYFFEINLQPTEMINNDIIQYEVPNPCIQSLWPEINFPQDNINEFYYSSSLYYPYDNSPYDLVGFTNFTLTTPSYIYIWVGYQFLPNDFSLSLYSFHHTSISDSILSRNQEEIFIQLPIGQYSIELTTTSNDNIISHCSEYSLIIYISNNHKRSECISYLPLPKDLQNEGSIYGGPIDSDGYLSFYGPSFLYSPYSDHISSILFSIKNTSRITITTDAKNQNDHSGLSIDLKNHETSMIMTPIYSYISYDNQIYQKIYQLNVNESTINNYDIILYDGSLSSNNCPTFALGIELATNKYINDYYGNCPLVLSTPASIIEIDENGIGNQWISSSFEESSLGLLHEISFSIEKSSNIQIILGYISYISYGQVKLVSNDDSSEIIIETGSQILTNSQSLTTNTEISIEKQLEEGNYKIQFLLSKLNDKMELKCYPFTWYTQIYPIESTTYINSVSPSNLNNIYPNQTLNLEITFSGMIFSNSIPINSKNSEPMTRAIYLQPSNNSTNSFIFPDYVFNTDNLGKKWNLVFNSNSSNFQFIGNEKYLLRLTNVLHDIHGHFVFIYSSNIYSILPNCSDHEFIYGDSCICLDNYSGDSCDQCADGYQYYPTCSLINNCNPSCIHGSCNDTTCYCDHGWDGNSCQYCAHSFTGSDCSTCEYPFTGYNCTDCIYPFTGTYCESCEYPFTGSNCSSCIEPFTGDNCSECIYPSYDENCSNCIYPFTNDSQTDNYENSNSNYPVCPFCIYPYSGNDCNDCIYPFTGENCTLCEFPFTGTNCSSCEHPFTGENCTECDFPYAGDNCTDCVHPYSGPHCGDCVFPFTGDFCNECADNFVGKNCEFCSLGFIDPSTNCTTCAPNWNDDCSACKINWDGPTCSYCAEHWTGDNCEECINNWEGSSCNICPPRFLASPGNCALCSPPYKGDNCTECEDGFFGETCLPDSQKSNDESLNFLVDPFIYETIVIVLGMLLCFICILMILVAAYLRIQKHKVKFIYFVKKQENLHKK